jgi:hypothetical protein
MGVFEGNGGHIVVIWEGETVVDEGVSSCTGSYPDEIEVIQTT